MRVKMFQMNADEIGKVTGTVCVFLTEGQERTCVPYQPSLMFILLSAFRTSSTAL